MAKRFTDTEIWQKEWFFGLSLKHKLLVKFLFDNCDCAGIYQPNFALLSVYIGETVTEKDFDGLKQVKKLTNGNYLIEDFLKFQYGITDYDSLNPKLSVHKGIIKSLEKNQLLNNSLIRVSQPLTKPCPTLSQGLQDMDKDMDKDKDTSTIFKEKENQEKKKKADPYTEVLPKLKNLAKTVFGKAVLVSNEDCLRAVELASTYEDFWETLENLLQQVKMLDFKGYKPKLNWLLKEKNYIDIRNGSYLQKTGATDSQKTLTELKNGGKTEDEILEFYRKQELKSG